MEMLVYQPNLSASPFDRCNYFYQECVSMYIPETTEQKGRKCIWCWKESTIWSIEHRFNRER